MAKRHGRTAPTAARPAVMGQAVAAGESGSDEMAQVLDGFTESCVERTVDAVRELLDQFA